MTVTLPRNSYQAEWLNSTATTAIVLDKTTNISIVIYCGDGGYVFEDVNGKILPSDYMTKKGAGGGGLNKLEV